MKSRGRVFGILLLLYSLSGSTASAQWVKIAPNRIAPSGIVPNHFGAIHYKAGIVWAGWRDLWFSGDLGITWQQSSPPIQNDLITDIFFFDRTNGLISTVTQGVFLTRNGGLSWQKIISNLNGVLNVAFGQSAQEIFALSSDGFFYASENGGASWNKTRPGADFGTCFTVAKDYAIYTSTTQFDPVGEIATISRSTDKGLSWQIRAGTPSGDSYSIIADSCDERKLLLVSEAHESSVSPGDLSQVFVSSDGGDSWKSTLARHTYFLSGGVTSNANVIYLPELDSSIYRSTDHGETWATLLVSDNTKFAFDSRNVTIVDENIVFALDDLGSIWKTVNSGGDSVIVPPGNGNLSFLPDTLFANTIVSPCDDSVTQSVQIIRECFAPNVADIAIVGVGVFDYVLQSADRDKVSLSYLPHSFGAEDALMIFTMTDGAHDTVYLKGKGSRKPYLLSIQPDTLFRGDSAFTCDSVSARKISISATGCPLPRVVGKSVVGINASDYRIISAPDSIHEKDSIIISLHPSGYGERSASVVLTLDDGGTVTVPLTGYGLAPLPLQVATADAHSDTLLGGTVQIPITITGMQKPENVSAVVHYDTSLQYRGTFSVALLPVKLDLPNEQWVGRSKIAITNAKPGVVLAYATFEVFNDSIVKQHVSFDSITVTTAIPPCRYDGFGVVPAVSEVSAIDECGTLILSRFMLYGEQPQFRLSPNPTSGGVTLCSHVNVGDVTLTVTDILGTVVGISNLVLTKDIPFSLSLGLPNGIYDLRLQSRYGLSNLRVVVQR